VGITPGRPIRCRPGPFARPVRLGKLGPGRAPGGPPHGARGTRRAGRGPWSGLRGASWRRPWPWLLGPWCLVRRPGGRCLCLCRPGGRCLCGRSQTQARYLVAPGARSVDQGPGRPGTRPTRDQADQGPGRPGTRPAIRRPGAAARATWCAVPGARPGFPGARPGARPTRHQGRRPGAGGQASRALQRK
jgi:hypothetical protein